MNDIIDALNADCPVVIGINVYNSFYDLETPGKTVLSMPAESDELIGGHAVCLVGYDLNKQLLLARNSFGTDWGEQGYFYIPFDYMTKDVMDCWMFDIELK